MEGETTTETTNERAADRTRWTVGRPGNSAATGNNDVQWVKVFVNARSREVFSFEPQVIPANRTAVPAP